MRRKVNSRTRHRRSEIGSLPRCGATRSGVARSSPGAFGRYSSGVCARNSRYQIDSRHMLTTGGAQHADRHCRAMTAALAWVDGAGFAAQPRQITSSWASFASWSGALPSEACAAPNAGFDLRGNFCADDRLGSSPAPSQANAPAGCELYVPTNVDGAHPASAVDNSNTANRKETLFGIVASRQPFA